MAGGAAVLLTLFGSWRFYGLILRDGESTLNLLGMAVPHSALWAAALFAGLGAVTTAR